MAQTAEQEKCAEDFLLQRYEWPQQPVGFSELAAKRGQLHLEALRQTLWALIEAGELQLTSDRRIRRVQR